MARLHMSPGATPQKPVHAHQPALKARFIRMPATPWLDDNVRPPLAEHHLPSFVSHNAVAARSTPIATLKIRIRRAYAEPVSQRGAYPSPRDKTAHGSDRKHDNNNCNFGDRRVARHERSGGGGSEHPCLRIGILKRSGGSARHPEFHHAGNAPGRRAVHPVRARRVAGPRTAGGGSNRPAQVPLRDVPLP